MLLVRDWRISIHFACFCFWMTVTIMIDGSVKHNRKFGLNFRVRMLLKSAVMVLHYIISWKLSTNQEITSESCLSK